MPAKKAWGNNKRRGTKNQRKISAPPNGVQEQSRRSETELKGWTAIAAFLAIPVSTAHRWARDGMPVRHEGRFTVANADDLRAWLGREAHMPAPVQILTDKSDVAGALKRSIAASRSRKRA